MYNQAFFKNQQQGSLSSAKVVVPLVLELVPAKSIVDIGCGTGTWLSQFIQNGLSDVMGVDGPWVKEEMLHIPVEKFIKADLTKPLNLPRKFDLAISLEVAEHLDAQYADIFIETLAKSAPVVVFSAAIPHQGGVHHVNEQWPEYWQEKFLKNDYVVIDCMRKRIWKNPLVQWWYAQNLLIFIDKNKLDQFPTLQKEVGLTRPDQLSMVHPKNSNYGKSIKNVLLSPLYKIVDSIR